MCASVVERLSLEETDAAQESNQLRFEENLDRSLLLETWRWNELMLGGHSLLFGGGNNKSLVVVKQTNCGGCGGGCGGGDGGGGGGG